MASVRSWHAARCGTAGCDWRHITAALSALAMLVNTSQRKALNPLSCTFVVRFAYRAATYSLGLQLAPRKLSNVLKIAQERRTRLTGSRSVGDSSRSCAFGSSGQAADRVVQDGEGETAGQDRQRCPVRGPLPATTVLRPAEPRVASRCRSRCRRCVLDPRRGPARSAGSRGA